MMVIADTRFVPGGNHARFTNGRYEVIRDERCLAIHSIGAPCPSWATRAVSTDPVSLEIIALWQLPTELPFFHTNAKQRTTFAEHVVPEHSYPTCQLAIVSSSDDLEDAMYGLVSAMVSPSLIAIDWSDICLAAGIIDPRDHIEHAGSPNSALLRPRLGQAFIVQGLPRGTGEVARTVRENLRALARRGFDGGIFLNCRMVDPSPTDWTLDDLDGFLAEAIADRRNFDIAVAATTGAQANQVVVYAFQANKQSLPASE